MSDRPPVNPLLKSALDLGPVIGFLVAYMWFKDSSVTVGGTTYDGFIAVTAAFIPVFLLSIAILWRLTGELSRMQVFTAIMIIIFGGLSVWLNDERFIKIKPTIVYAIFGGLLGFGLLRGQSYLRFLMEGLMPLKDEGWMILTKRATAFFFGMAALNEFVWRFMSTDAFVFFDTIGQPAAVFAFFLSQAGLFNTYAIEEDENT